MKKEGLYEWVNQIDKTPMMLKAIDLAFKAHKGQVDKGGETYIDHPLRVMYRLQSFEEEVMIVGLLHDVIEDTNYTSAELSKMGFDQKVIDGLLSVTRNAFNQETYAEFVQRAKLNEIGRKVKIADLKENMDLSRLAEVTEKDLSRLKRYEKALKELESN